MASLFTCGDRMHETLAVLSPSRYGEGSLRSGDLLLADLFGTHVVHDPPVGDDDFCD